MKWTTLYEMTEVPKDLPDGEYMVELRNDTLKEKMERRIERFCGNWMQPDDIFAFDGVWYVARYLAETQGYFIQQENYNELTVSLIDTKSTLANLINMRRHTDAIMVEKLRELDNKISELIKIVNAYGNAITPMEEPG